MDKIKNPEIKPDEIVPDADPATDKLEYDMNVADKVSEVFKQSELIEKAKAEVTKVVKQAGDLLLKLLGNVGFEFKGDGSHVTQADVKAQEIIKNHLKAAFPDFSFLGEEGENSESEKSDFEWVVDPLDGTINFGNDIDFFAISVGLKYKNTPVLGVVYIPAQKELLTGDIAGKSTFNDAEIEKSSEKIHNKKPFADGVWNKNTVVYTEAASKLKGKPRTMGSAVHTLMDVAKGGFSHAVLSNVFIWDILAAVPILRGAGADLLVWHDGQWKKYEEIDPALFNQKNSFTVLAANKANLDYLKDNITIDKTRKFDFSDEKPALKISSAEKKEAEYDSAILDRFQSLFAKIAEITRNVINSGEKKIRLKEDDSEQTNEDIRIEEKLKELLLSEFPDFNFMGEETQKVLSESRYGFIVDPIDGTTNYSNNLPSFATIVCLTFDNKPISGLIYFPKLDMAIFNNADSTFVNRFNHNNETNLKKVGVKDDLFENEDPNLPFGFGSHARKKIKYNQEVAKVFNQPRTFGSAASIISFTSTGSLRGFILTDAKLYDYAGGVPLIEKGGGKIYILDEKDGCWKEYAEMFEELSREPETKRYVIGGGPNTVKKLIKNMHPEIK